MTAEILVEYEKEAKEHTQTVKSMFEKQAQAARVSASIHTCSHIFSCLSGAVEPGTF